MRAQILAFGLVALPNVVLCSCSKKEDPVALAPSASALAVSSAAPSASAWHFTVDPKGAAHVDMPGVKEHIVGDTTAAAGTLDVVPADLAQSRGTVKIDLSTFATHTFGTDDDAAQTEHARTWLEVVVEGQMVEANRWATFAIRSIDGLSATDVSKVEPTHEGGDEVRTVTMTVHGDLLIHGHELQKDDVVDVTFRYPAGAPPGAKPSRVGIKSKQPMRVILKEVDVRPRDAAGKLAEWTTRLVSKVAEFADITVDIGATPAQ